MDEFTKSIRAVLYDRIKSPLAGTLFLSWIVWNWRILFLVFFVSESKIKGTRIDFILNNYSDCIHLVWGPLGSTVFLLTIFPIFSFGAFWLNLYFKKKNKAVKYNMEGETPLTLDESTALRKLVDDEKNRLSKLLVENENTIIDLKAKNEELSSQDKQQKTALNNSRILKDKYDQEIEKFKTLNNDFILAKRDKDILYAQVGSLESEAKQSRQELKSITIEKNELTNALEKQKDLLIQKETQYKEMSINEYKRLENMFTSLPVIHEGFKKLVSVPIKKPFLQKRLHDEARKYFEAQGYINRISLAKYIVTEKGGLIFKRWGDAGF
ncbi:MAG: hypothetical protein HQ521_02225 [Bacteroidetes bacterium]|nr:hypothetical protein [Bacteroidota bacterium]